MTTLSEFPFAHGPDIRPSLEHDRIRASGQPTRVRLADGNTALIVADYDDVRTVLSDSRFSRQQTPGNPMFARSRVSLALSTSDAPDHTRRRKAIAHVFSVTAAQRLGPALEQLVDELLDIMDRNGNASDLVAEFTLPFTMRVMCRLLGIPEEDCSLLKPWVDALMSVRSYPADHVAACHQRVHEYFRRLVENKQETLAVGRPDTDLLTDLIQASDTERGLSTEEIGVMGAGLLMAGYETSSNHLASCAYLLLTNPVLANRLRGDLACIPTAVEEMLRFISVAGTGGHKHIAIDDVPLKSAIVHAGEIVIPLIEAADHDPVVFPSADEFQAGRSPNPHIAFGHGRHFCPGAALARSELAIGITRLLARYPTLALAVPPQQITWREEMYIGGPWSLPVRW